MGFVVSNNKTIMNELRRNSKKWVVAHF